MNTVKKNFFNGEFLIYYIDIDFYLKIKKYFKIENFYLYKKTNNYIEYTLVTPNKYYILPIGLFSNKNFILRCIWEKNEKTFLHPMNNDIQSTIQLYDVQKEIINEFEKNRKEITEENTAPCYLNLVGNCSIGKTVITVHILSCFKYKAFIITPTIELAKQWKKQIDTHLKNVNCIASLNGVQKLLKNENLKTCDILVIPYKHLSNDEFNKFLSTNFTVGVIDEQHTYNLETNNILRSFIVLNSFSIMISLTATPRFENSFYLGREINLQEIIDNFNVFDFKKYAYEIILKDNTNLLNFKNTENHTKYISFVEKKKHLTKKDILFLSIIKKRAISEDENRIHHIVNNIITTFTNNENVIQPKILILTKFVSEINIYYDRLIKANKKLENFIFKIYAKKNKENDLETFSNLKVFLEKLDKYIIIGTEDQLGTGIDLKELNILHLTSVTSNINNLIQYAGRICRKNNSKIHSLYYYNINNLEKISIEKNIETMRTTLKKNNWLCFVKPI